MLYSNLILNLTRMSSCATDAGPPLCHTSWNSRVPLFWGSLLLRPVLTTLHILLCNWLDHRGWTLVHISTLPCRRLRQWWWVLVTPFPTVLRLERLLVTGFVTSPNFPGEYPNNLAKTQTIQVEQGQILSLKFTAFDTKGDILNCVSNYLTITDGDGTTLMEKSCGSSSVGNVNIGGQNVGSSLPPNVRSRTNVVNLFFKTDAWESVQIAVTGWSLNWSAMSPDFSTEMIQVTSVQTTASVPNMAKGELISNNIGQRWQYIFDNVFNDFMLLQTMGNAEHIGNISLTKCTWTIVRTEEFLERSTWVLASVAGAASEMTARQKLRYASNTNTLIQTYIYIYVYIYAKINMHWYFLFQAL